MRPGDTGPGPGEQATAGVIAGGGQQEEEEWRGGRLSLQSVSGRDRAAACRACAFVLALSALLLWWSYSVGPRKPDSDEA